ncbi:MAG: hypothetical protein ACR2MU_05695, partial [Gaiellaceae bacterium]
MALVAVLVVAALGAFASAGSAARNAAPRNTQPPTVSGTPTRGETLKADRGEFSGNPTDYNYFWVRCEKNGGSCSNISGAHTLSYKLTSADVGHTLRFKVQAKNADRSIFASSVPTAVIASSGGGT